MTPDPCKRPALWPALLGIGVWIVAVLMISLALPGNLPLAFVAGAVIGWPAFLPMDSYVCRAASARMFRLARTEQRVLGRDGNFEARQKQMAALRSLELGPAANEALQWLMRSMKWAPSGLFALISLYCLAAGGAEEGVSSTAATVCSGTAAMFAFLAARRADRILATPWDDAGRPIHDLRGR